MDALAETTELVVRTRQGDAAARAALFERLYEPLRRIAHQHLSRRFAGASGAGALGTTELVHEGYLKLVDTDRLAVADRAHFYAVSAQVMRQVLVDHFRKRRASKRGGDLSELSLEEGNLPVGPRGEILIALDQALRRLSELDPRAGRVVELKFFGGMTEPEIGEALGISVRTVSGDWRAARAWLTRELGGA